MCLLGSNYTSFTPADFYLCRKTHFQNDFPPRTRFEKVWERRTSFSYLTSGTDPWLLMGCSGTHCWKLKVMTGRGSVRAIQGYSHRGWGSASRDSRKSKDCWRESDSVTIYWGFSQSKAVSSSERQVRNRDSHLDHFIHWTHIKAFTCTTGSSYSPQVLREE